MAPSLLPAALTLALSLLLAIAAAQTNPSSYDISAEHGWDKFVKEAAKGTGGTPINMDDFVTRVNGNIKGRGDEEDDPELMEELKSFDQGKRLSSGDAELGRSPEADAGMDDLATARMIAAVNGGSLAPENAPANGDLGVRVCGVVFGVLPALALFFLL